MPEALDLIAKDVADPGGQVLPLDPLQRNFIHMNCPYLIPHGKKCFKKCLSSMRSAYIGNFNFHVSRLAIVRVSLGI